MVYRSNDQWSIVRNQETSSSVFWGPNARHQVEPILTGTIEEVVPQVSHSRFVKVIESTLLRALSGTCEISLEGACSTVCLRDGIGVLRPNYTNGFERTEKTNAEDTDVLGRPPIDPHGRLRFHSPQIHPRHAIAL
jgi:hypothetical protein